MINKREHNYSDMSGVSPWLQKQIQSSENKVRKEEWLLNGVLKGSATYISINDQTMPSQML